MAQFLRDLFITNTKIKEDDIIQLIEVFANRGKALIEYKKNAGVNDYKPGLSLVIRFDGKGYRLFSTEELLRHFNRAKKVERMIFTIESTESIKSNRAAGEYLEVRFDTKDLNNCYLQVSSDDSDWVDSSYSAVQEFLNKCKTKYGWVRTGWTTLAIQLLGVIGGFGLSLWAASIIAPSLKIENAFIITFFFALLIFSNFWAYIYKWVLLYVDSVFPNIHFYRPNKDRINWLMQALIGGIATAFALWILNLIFKYIGSVLSGIPK